ncbi:MAG: hypothetical protein ABIP78_00560 [Pyrinomonadaceae bacterium]
MEILLEIRREMALEADYDVDLFAEMARSGNRTAKAKRYRMEPVSPVNIDASNKNGKLKIKQDG